MVDQMGHDQTASDREASDREASDRKGHAGGENRLTFSTATQQAAWVASGEVTSVELVEHVLARIEKLNPELNAFSAVIADSALAEARDRDAATARGAELGPLHGVPIAIKDENDVAGLPTCYGGAAFTTPASADSEVVRRLRAAGAVIVGKTRMPEFGIWPFTETAANGFTRNPWNPLRSTAGSSGGTAAAVASGMVAVGIGGDGGGSIRLPSSFCGLFGLKCQRGRTSAAPNAHLWRSLGVIGPLARSVADSALVYDAITGSTSTDAWHADPLPTTLTAALAEQPGSLRIGVCAANPTGGPAADADQLRALRRTADALRDLGHQVVEVDPEYPKVSASFSIQVGSGVFEEAERAEHPDLLEPRTRGLARLGRGLHPLAGWAERQGIAAGVEFNEAYFGHHDLLLTPTSPTPAVPIGQLDGLGLLPAMRKATPAASFTSIWNVLGNPAAAIPAGFTDDGLPLSVQLVGPLGGEPRLVQVAAQLERALPWASTLPPIS